MIKFKHKAFAAFISVLFFGLQVFAGNSEEYSKKYHESYQVNSDVILTVTNKYGFVKVVTSETDHITIDVKVSIEANSQEKAQKTLDKIQIDIDGSPSHVNAVTSIIKEAKFKELSIDYTITMPMSGNTDLTNKFGDLYLNELDGNAKIYVAYGAMDVGKLNSQTNDITVKFGSGKVTYAQYLNYVSRYSTVDVGRAKLLNLDTQYGTTEVGEVGRLKLDAAYEDIDLGTIVELTAVVKFGDLEVEGVISKLDLELKYGDAEIDFISKDFTEVSVEAGFGDVDLAFQTGSNFVLEGKSSFGDINIPGGTISNVDDSGSGGNYNGKLFEGASPSTVRAKISYGDLDIRIH